MKNSLSFQKIWEALKVGTKKVMAKNWYLTIIFFLVIFVISIWIWWDCVYKPQPSEATTAKFSQKQQDFRLMNQKISQIIEKLKAKQERFENMPDVSQQRELFVRKEIPIEINKSPNTKINTNQNSNINVVDRAKTVQ